MVARRDPIREWREQYARCVLNIDFEPLPSTAFRASVTPLFQDLRVVRAVLSPGITFRDEDLVKDGDDALALIIAQSGTLDVTHQGRDLRLSHGEAALLQVCATGRVGSRQSFGYVALLIPQAEFAARGLRPNDVVMRRLTRRTEALQLLSGYVRSLERIRPGASPDIRETVRRHIIDLVVLALAQPGALGECGLSAVTATRLNAALDHIAACFQEPDLSVAAVARRQGISPRYLQRLLEMSGTSFTERVNELRLQRAFTLLTASGGSARRISEIALEAGFSDVSHFNRLFRSRFGETPSAVRTRSSGAQ